MKLKLADYEAIVLVLENEGGFHRKYNCPTQNYTMGMRRSIIGDWLWKGRTVFLHSYVHADVEDRDQLRRYFDARYGIETDEVNKYAHIPSVWDSDSEPLPPMNPALKPFVRKFVESVLQSCWARAVEANRRKAVNYSANRFGYYCYSDQQFPQVAAAIEAAYGKMPKAKAPTATIAYDLETGPIGRIDQLLSEISTTLNQSEDIVMNAPTILTVETRTFVNGDDIAKMPDSQIYDLIAQQEKAIEKLNEIKAKPKKLVDEIAKRQAGIAALVAHLDKAA